MDLVVMEVDTEVDITEVDLDLEVVFEDVDDQVKDRIEPTTPICVSQRDILFALPVGSFMSTLFVRTYTPATIVGKNRSVILQSNEENTCASIASSRNVKKWV